MDTKWVKIVDVLVLTGLAKSKSDARRMIRAGAVTVKDLGPNDHLPQRSSD